jgi:MFS family permease
MVSGKLARIFLSKAARVFVSGLISVMTPVYLAILGYSPYFIGISLLMMVAGNVVSNVIVLRYERSFGRRRFLMAFSAFILISGLMLFSSANALVLLLALFIGNISTTGTEAGPFQSIEVGVIPVLVSARSIGRTFGAYNVIGFGAASVGALAASLPAYFGNGSQAFRDLYLLWGVVGALLIFIYAGLGDIETGRREGAGQAHESPEGARKDIKMLSVLNSVDGFGGGFVTQSLFSYWFFLVYKISLQSLGIVFFIVNLIIAASLFVAPMIAERLGNLRTMVSTHLISNVLLAMIPFAGSLNPALFLLFVRQSLSSMDVPTRQAMMAEIFEEGDRVSASATTNTSRSIGGLFGAPISGVLFGVGLVGLPMVIGSVSKIAYDIWIFQSYRRRVR